MSLTLSKLFYNYQNDKLNIITPDLTNFFIISFFFLLIVLSLRKVPSNSSNLLNPLQTEQIKGLSIFFVLLGHLWIHVAQTKASIILSGDAVGAFLLLSGFGLTMSSKRKTYNFQSFFSKRIKRVMIPYWIITICIFCLDYAFLCNRIPFYDLLITLSGINLSSSLRNIDYTRWFVTFILFWYLLFFIFNTKFLKREAIILLLIIAFFLFPINYYVFNFGWYKIFFFPIGCAIAFQYKNLQNLYLAKRLLLFLATFISILYVLTFKLLISNDKWHIIIIESVPNIILSYIYEFNTLLLCISVIIIFAYVGEKRIKSNLLLFLGKYSYEIFLLHGVFLIKYNPIIKSENMLPVLGEFFLFTALIVFLSFFLSTLAKKFHGS